MHTTYDPAFYDIYQTYINRVTIHAYKFTGDWDDAHTAAQDAFQTAWLKYSDFTASPNQLGWLMNTAKYHGLNLKRARQRRQQLFVSMELLPDDCTPYTLDSLIENPLEDLEGLIPKKDFDLLTQIYLSGIRYEELAEDLGISMDACYKRVQRATKKFAKAYSKKNRKKGKNNP